jgi:hypothetical protein
LFATGVKFAAGVVDSGGNLPPVSTRLVKLGQNLLPAAKLPPVSLTPGENLPPVLLIPVVHLDLQISLHIFEKI